MFVSPGDRAGRRRDPGLIDRHIFATGEATHTFVVPPGFGDIELVVVGRSTSAATNTNLACTINGLSSSIYSTQRSYANNTTVAADQFLGGTSIGSAAAMAIGGASAQAGQQGYVRLRFIEYADPTVWKSGEFTCRVAASNATDTSYYMMGNFQIDTLAPISTLTVAMASGAIFAAGSRAILRGIP